MSQKHVPGPVTALRGEGVCGRVRRADIRIGNTAALGPHCGTDALQSGGKPGDPHALHIVPEQRLNVSFGQPESEGGVMPDETLGEGLLDVTELSLRDLDRIDRPVLRRAIQRIVDNKDTGPVAGFSAYVDDDDTPQTGELRSPDHSKS